MPIVSLALILTLTPAATEVKLGEPVKLTVTLDNQDKKQAWNGPALIVDSRAITLTVNENGHSFTYTQTMEAAPGTMSLAAGEKQTAVVEFTPIEAGKLTIEAGYAGKAAGKTEVTVAPLDGAKRIGVRLETNKGPIIVRLLPEAAPNTAAHFANLVRTGFYNGVGFHRIIKNFMAQGGDPKGTGQGGPGYSIPAEFSHDPKFSHTYGRLSMARTSDPDSAGSQFFLCFGQATFLDKQYTVFGEVVEGVENVKKIEAVGMARDPGTPGEPVVIQNATLVPIK